MTSPDRQKYSGSCRKLVLAFDLGTTFSGISYCILDPGKVPEVKPVTRYPCQESVGGDVKIPTVIYYDKEGMPCAIGAETLQEGIEVDAKENGWYKAQWFKLHLRPTSNTQPSFVPAGFYDGNGLLPALPPNKSVVQVIADFMRYLFECSESYIRQTHGEQLWASVEASITYVLTHPNGWGGQQQAHMRRAAILAGLVPDTDEGSSKIIFVTEGEASLHFCLKSGLSLALGSASTMVVDAGGGTVDLTAYCKTADGKFEEVSVPTCFFQGAAFVTVRAQHFFEELLRTTRFEDDIETLTTRFDRVTKHVFKQPDESYHIQFGSHRDRDTALNIRGGRLSIAGSEIVKFFEPSVTCIVNAIHAQRMAAQAAIKSICLVGGFSASTWLYESVRENKAVSSGAISFFLDRLVTSRVARATYGVSAGVIFDPSNPQHRQRQNRVIMNRGTKVAERQEFRRSLFEYVDPALPRTRAMKVPVFFHSGLQTNMLWVNENPTSFPVLCTIEADISQVRPQWRVSSVGVQYQIAHYDVVLLLGLTELKAQIAYFENGVEKRGPAKVVYGVGH
ncbi:hypothetical protein NMY22_g12377 [Coprinellus aureogranulatus]|nr:hypothetical protein NMY22_g12377 [Coprinellus aureogranulatus]